MRSFLYWLARLLGDLNAGKKSEVGRRIGQRGPAGKLFICADHPSLILRSGENAALVDSLC